MKVFSPFINRVPSEVTANLRYRAQIHRRVSEDPDYAEVLWDICARDPLYYISVFGWTEDPRAQPFTRLPFILWPFQQRALLEILQCINNEDLLIEKSRDMGASWLCCLAYEWLWHFCPVKLTFLIGSRNDEYVDDADNPKSLLPKIDFFHKYLPEWLMPDGYDSEKNRRKGHFLSPWNGSTITGESTTKNFARGGRFTSILLDEYAANDAGYSILSATRDATRSRIFNSTPQGTGNAFHDIRHGIICPGTKTLTVHWREHPFKSAGMYSTAKDGTLEILHKEGYPRSYKPILDGKLRSPAYDREEARSSPREMAQEWDIDYLGSGDQFFKPQVIQDCISKFARPPLRIGDLDYDSVTAEPTSFSETTIGRLSLWCQLEDGKVSQEKKYVLGVDVSAGTGSSNSCICGYNAETNEKVLEYVNPYIRPEEFARQAVAIARWLGDTTIIWEGYGPGQQFGARVIELGYYRVYMRKREESISKKNSDVPGFAPTGKGKATAMGAYRDALAQGICANRSKAALEECLEYVHVPNGGVEHARASNKQDPSGAGASHGDRVIGDMLAWHLLSARQVKPRIEKPEPPAGSLAWRMKMREQSKQKPGRELLHSEGWGA